MLEKLRDFARQLNEYGIPLPYLKDPATGKSSVSLTMVFIAFNINIAGLLGKLSGFLGTVDLSGANTLFMTTAGLYFARRVSKTGDKSISVETEGSKE